MKTEDELRALAKLLQQAVDRGIALGLCARPDTVLEKHAFELGRLHMVLSLLPPETPAAPSFYDKWVGLWCMAHPNKTPPTRKQFDEICELFNLTPEQLGIEIEPQLGIEIEPPTP